MIRSIDLSGEWRLALSSPEQTDIPEIYNDVITLPNTVSNARKCAPNDNRDTGFLTDTYSFEGCAWFERTIETDGDYENIVLFLERTRITSLYVDGKPLGTRNSICSPHIYDLGALARGKHTLLICVRNFGYPTRGGHLTSPDTQTNWIGITGRIELRAYGKAYADNIMIFSDTEKNTVRVTADIIGGSDGEARIRVDGMDEITVSYRGGRLDAEYSMGSEKRLWSEYEHNTFTMSVDIDGDTEKAVFGMRKISSDGLKLLVNGRQVFLRGKHDGMIFPQTGFAPTDVDSWLSVMKTARSYGINHYRFHTCCPPEAAFTAADMLGIYMEPELPFWGTVTAPDEEGHNAAEQDFLISEGFNMLKHFGNHPSFAMMSMGNELWGNRDRINEIIHGFKTFDNRHFYTGGSNNFQFCPSFLQDEDFWVGVRFDAERLIRGSYAMCDAPLGFIQTDRPNTSHSYDKMIVPKLNARTDGEKGSKTIQIQYGTGVKTVSADDAGDVLIPQLPVISHEIGQYGMYPDFNEAEHYKGSIKPRYLEVFKERLVEKDLFGYWNNYFKASSALAVECYKLELEAAFRSKNLSGFQLLDLQDFSGQGVALVGVLNPLMESKGVITPEKWRSFCNDTVIMAQTERFVYRAGEKIKVDILLSCCEFDKLKHGSVSCTFDERLTERLSFDTLNERVTSLGSIEIDTSEYDKPVTKKLVVTLDGSDISNEYSFRIYPDIEAVIDEKTISHGGKTLFIAHTVNEAEQLKAEEKKPLLIPERSENDVDGTYCTDFWNYHMFAMISRSMNKPVPTGTMGLFIDKENPIMKSFLSDYFTTPQWYNFIMHAHCTNLDGAGSVKIIAESIDNTDRCSRLGVLYEQNGMPVCTSRLWEIGSEPEIKILAAALVEHYA